MHYVSVLIFDKESYAFRFFLGNGKLNAFGSVKADIYEPYALSRSRGFRDCAEIYFFERSERSRYDYFVIVFLAYLHSGDNLVAVLEIHSLNAARYSELLREFIRTVKAITVLCRKEEIGIGNLLFHCKKLVVLFKFYSLEYRLFNVVFAPGRKLDHSAFREEIQSRRREIVVFCRVERNGNFVFVAIFDKLAEFYSAAHRSARLG